MLRNTQQLIHRSINRGWMATLGATRLRLIMLQHADFRKLINLLSIKVQKRLRRETITALPYRYKIDPTNNCKLHCPLCPTGLKYPFRKKGFMPLPEFEKLIDQIASHALVLDLFGWGEPMLHPDIFKMIRYASERGLFIRTSSTLHQVSRLQAEKIIDSGLDAIIVGIDGSIGKTHEKFRAGSKLSQVISSIEDLVALKKEKGSPSPHITVRMLINRHNEEQVSTVREMVSEMGVDAFTVGQIAINTNDDRQARQWLPHNSKISAYGKNMKNQGSCSDLWESLVINYDGGISPCCWQYNKKMDIGNCFETPVKELWNSPSLVAARCLVLGKPVAEKHKDIACHQCQGTPDYLVP